VSVLESTCLTFHQTLVVLCKLLNGSSANSFDNYAYLWIDDRNEFMKQFLTYGHVLTTEEIEAHAEEGVPENPPTLDMFKDQVT